ncbi:MAG: endonuclease/exonuclease/phosphatase family protein [Saprospiraceae bacterium]|nr:endonuclease/exonuclease/phosphatase family protein [Saprospiraceae bacterium]
MRIPFLYVCILGCILPSLFSHCASARNMGQGPVVIGFYNVENLFDTVDDPDRADEDFTPDGKQHWTRARYQKKLDHLAQVIAGMGYPEIMGFAEVENRSVLQDLCQTDGLADKGYHIAHFDSPDHRGIDVALIYQSSRFESISSTPVHVTIDDVLVPEYTTRDILYCQLRSKQGHDLHLLVNHWPSRRDGPEVSGARRMQVARQLDIVLQSIRTDDPDAYIVVLGDFNDEPVDLTLREGIHAGPISDPDALLFNTMWELDATNQGSYYYKGDWNMLDQILLSRNFTGPKPTWTYDTTSIYKDSFMLYKDKKYGPLPNRTYGGTRYFGGYSDHLPVMIRIRE